MADDRRGDFAAWEQEMAVPDEALSSVARPWPYGAGATLAPVTVAAGDVVLYVGPVDWLSPDGEDRRVVVSRVVTVVSGGMVEARLPSGAPWACHHTRVRMVI